MRQLMFLLLFLLFPFALLEAQNGNDHNITLPDTVSEARTFDYFYHQALLKREAECYDEAYDLFEHCLSLNPGSPVVLYELYSMYLYLGRTEEALSMIEQAVKGDSTNFWYRSVLASTYNNVGKRQEAKDVYRGITEDFSSHPEVYYQLAGMYIEDSEYDKAIEAFSNIERIEGKNEHISIEKYKLYLYMNDKEAAIQELQQLFEEYPEELRIKVYIGDTYLDFGDKQKAFDIYKSVLDADADNAEAQTAMAEYYRLQGNDSLYTACMEQLFMNSRFTGDNRLNLLGRYIGQKERTDSTGYNRHFLKRITELPYDQAENMEIYASYLLMKKESADSVAPILERLLQYAPDNRFAQLQLLKIAIDKEDYNDVIMRCDTAILYNPEMLELYYYSGIAHYNLKNLSEAVSTLKKGLNARMSSYANEFISDIYALIGDIYHEMKNNDACVVAYDSALIYNSENTSVLNNYAYYITIDGGNLDKAEEMSYRAVKADPENSTYIDTYMWVLFKMGRYDEAKAYAEKLLAIEGEEADKVLLHHCGDVYAKCGDMQRALQLWQQAYEKGDISKLLKKKIKRKKYYSDDKKR